MEDKLIDVLLVEDNKDEALLTVRALKKNNFVRNVLHLNGGEEALEYFFSGRDNPLPKVILLDLKMPKVDGIDVLRKIKLSDQLKALPVIMLTSSKEEKDIIESYKLGANAYIVKPMDTDKFIEAINTIGLFWLKLNVPPK